ncbi:MAG: hypothetical protein HY644_04485 [Acidobacteria bacterium]|nr:hypothetical protein [Acidobacteriota bacterium]
MPGYVLLEEKYLQPAKPDGFEPNPDPMGILDYLRELRQETFPFNEGKRLRIVGVEDLLIDASEKQMEVDGFIHQILISKANELNSLLGTTVQVVFRRPLHRAEDFWIENGMTKISLRRIFGSPEKKCDRNGNEYYLVGFNLT